MRFLKYMDADVFQYFVPATDGRKTWRMIQGGQAFIYYSAGYIYAALFRCAEIS